MRAGAVLAATLLVACAGANGSGAPAGGDAMMATMEVKVSPSSVRFVLHVTNTTDAPLEMTFPSSQRYDFIVRTRGGEEVWRWSEGMMFLQSISHATLAPGESWDMGAVWEPGDREGEHVVEGVLTARDHEVRQRAAFQLP